MSRGEGGGGGGVEKRRIAWARAGDDVGIGGGGGGCRELVENLSACLPHKPNCFLTGRY